MNRNKRYTKNINKLSNACMLNWVDIDNVFYKEKYGRFDMTSYKWWPAFQHAIDKIEDESLDMCQTCWKTSRQYWDDWWWVTHHCLKHYILLKLNKFWWLLKKTLKRFGKCV